MSMINDINNINYLMNDHMGDMFEDVYMKNTMLKKRNFYLKRILKYD